MRRLGILILLLLLILTSCSSHINDLYSWQLNIIYDNSVIWELSDEDRMDPDWYCLYAITDLDHDGYLEVCKRSVYSNGPVTRMWLYEVTSDMNIVRLESEIDEDIDYTSTNYPDLDGNEPIGFYQDEFGTYSYLVHDCKSYGLTSVYINYRYMALVDNRLVFRDVCYIHSENADETITYYNGEGDEISEEEYSAIYEDYVASAANNVNIGWFETISPESLSDSLLVFIGDDTYAK